MTTLQLDSRLQSRLGITPEQLAEFANGGTLLNWLCLGQSYTMTFLLIALLMC
jgi:hypothetical protein